MVTSHGLITWVCTVALGAQILSWRTPAEPVATRSVPGRQIIERPVAFGVQRQHLTLEYIRRHYDPAATDITLHPRMIVIHWTASPSLASALATFAPETLPPGRPELRRAGTVNVSAHFLVDRDGTIYRLMPEHWMARHTIGLNRSAIGIENVGGPQGPLTTAQVEANAWLVRVLVAQYPAIHFLIGHQEYGRFRATPLWQERDPTYFSSKPDPGANFMRRLRDAVQDLRLLDHYEPLGQ